MKKRILLFLIVTSIISFGQVLQVQNPVPAPGYVSPVWANDNVILNNEPTGTFSGVQKSDGKIYVAVHDTLFTSNLGLIILFSTNNGTTWSSAPGINYRGKIDNVKLLRTNLDSVYCYFQIDYHVYCWNIATSIINEIMIGGYRGFDVVTSSSASMYVFLDSLANNSVVRYSSINGGYNWYNRGSITSAGANPKVSMSGTGDTLLLNYYGPIQVDTSTSVIRVARYRETAIGTLTSATFLDIATETDQKLEYVAATNNSEMWFFYTVGPVGSRDIKARKSTNLGVSWEAATFIANNPNLDEYGIDIKYHAFNGYGFDLIYQADSSQTGPPTNASDKLLYSIANFGSASFTGLTQISDYPPETYNGRYSNALVPLPVTNDVGVLYVGVNGANKKLYWDRLTAVVPVELTSFSANKIDNKVVINWSTATEKNNKGFYVERKKANEQFTQIAFVQGMGTSLEQHNYSFIDKNLNAGKYFYRLRQVDFDGTSAISNTVEVDIANPVDYCLEQNYPNPFNPSTVINYTIPQQGLVTLKVYNVLGKEVATLVNEQQEAGRYNIELNATKLGINSGVYFYTLEAGNFKSTKKMIMMK